MSLRIPSRLDLLGVLDRVAQTLCERCDFDEDACAQVSMSVIEAGTNAIQHGHGRDASKAVDVEFHLGPEELEIRVHDDGKGFDIGKVNGDVTSPEHLLDARGRGIFIMKACMDRVEYEFGPTGTWCRLFKRRPRKVASA
ncbi:MAG: ATP-binding protein [Candidatus Eisenbacteria bacterium]|uniref:ATP-binding protein n=1 Tax=Eiseniibacteriota bacterium TaxID=2212470 RepID=A0A849SEC0_UNCEI|nr:ATP-binding protein [Candidatus Eisenbacteria bacterium]